MHPAAEAQLFFCEPEVVVRGGVLNGVVIGKIGLQDDGSQCVAAPSASSNLRDQLKRTLGSAEIGQAKHEINANDADQGHAVHVVTFGNHLRANENVNLAGVQPVEHTPEIITAAYSVAIQPVNARLREHAMQQLFQPLRAGAEKMDVLAAAVGAGPRNGAAKTAVVAFQRILALVMRKRDGAVLALH